MKPRDFQENPEDSVVSQKLSDTRKPKLTLRHLNKLGKMREIERLERLYNQNNLEMIYGNVEQSGEGQPPIF